MKYLLSFLTILFFFPSVTFSQALPVTTNGLVVTFLPDKQVITETSAKLEGIVSVEFNVTPVKVSFVSGVTGSPLGNEQQILSIPNGMTVGQTEPVTLNFSGLLPGKNYSFAFRSNGITSRPLSFTTPDGSSVLNPIFAGSSLGTNLDPGLGDTDLPTEEDFVEGLVPKCGRTPGDGIPESETVMCGWKDFLQLVSNVINYFILIIGPIIAILVMYIGAMIIMYGKKSDPTGGAMAKLKEYKQQLGRIVIGILIMLCAYLIVMTILRELGVKDTYILLDIIG